MRSLPFWAGRVTSAPSDQEAAYTFNIHVDTEIHIFHLIVKQRKHVQDKWAIHL